MEKPSISLILLLNKFITRSERIFRFRMVYLPVFNDRLCPTFNLHMVSFYVYRIAIYSQTADETLNWIVESNKKKCITINITYVSNWDTGIIVCVGSSSFFFVRMFVCQPTDFSYYGLVEIENKSTMSGEKNNITRPKEIDSFRQKTHNTRFCIYQWILYE